MLERSTIFLHRNCRHVWLGLNLRVTISKDFFGYFLSRKESNGVELAQIPADVKTILSFSK